MSRHVCGWCPLPLPDDPMEWYHHFLVVHRVDGYTVRQYPDATLDEELERLTRELD